MKHRKKRRGRIKKNNAEKINKSEKREREKKVCGRVKIEKR